MKLYNVVLYAKGHYQRSGDIWADLKKCLEGDDYTPWDKWDVFNIIYHVAQKHILTKNSAFRLGYVLDSLSPQECWKIGYYTKGNAPWLLREKGEELPEYDYYEAFVRSFFSLLVSSNIEDLEWTSWPEPSPSVLPLREKETADQ